MSIQFDH